MPFVKNIFASIERGRQFLAHDIWRIGLPGEQVPNGFIIKQIRAVILLIRGLIEETLLLRASALTFATLLFLVPFFVLMFYLIQTFNLGDQIYERMDEQLYKAVVAIRRNMEKSPVSPGHEGESHPLVPNQVPSESNNTAELNSTPSQIGDSDTMLKEHMIGLVFPILTEGHTVTDDPLYQNPVKLLVRLAEETASSPRTIGISGLLFILTTVFGFMRNVEYTFNRIWGVKRQRSPFRVISHYMMITLLLPFVAAFIMGISAALENQSISDMLGQFKIAVRIFQFVIICLSFTVVYLFVPNTKVYLRYALLGGIVGGTLYLLNSWMYVRFQYGLARYTTFFSTFALFPLLLMYIYFSWLIILFGALVSFAYQNEKTFAMERLAEDAPQAYREALAIRIMVELARRFNKALYPLNVKEMAERWNVPTRLVIETLDSLQRAKLVVACATTPVTYQPARSTRSIKLVDIVNALRENGKDPSLLRKDNKYRRLYDGLASGDPAIYQADIYTLSKSIPEDSPK